MTKKKVRRLNLDPRGGALYVDLAINGHGNTTANGHKKGASSTAQPKVTVDRANNQR